MSPSIVRSPDIYIAGVGQNKDGRAVASYWKNDSIVNLSNIQSYAYAIAVSGEDVYVAGQESGVATYWKNGLKVPLTSQSINSSAFSIYISGSEVYVAGSLASGNGNGYSYGVYWKNGVMTKLTQENNYSSASSILVVGNDVYISGSMGEANPNRYSYATYWSHETYCWQRQRSSDRTLATRFIRRFDLCHDWN